MRTSRPMVRRAWARSMTQGSPPISSGRLRAGRVTPSRRATGTAVRPYRAAVATMTRKVTDPVPLAAARGPLGALGICGSAPKLC